MEDACTALTKLMCAAGIGEQLGKVSPFHKCRLSALISMSQFDSRLMDCTYPYLLPFYRPCVGAAEEF